MHTPFTNLTFCIRTFGCQMNKHDSERIAGMLEGMGALQVDAMVETGLVAEVEGLLDRGFREGVTAPQAIGYKEIVEALDGFISLDEAVERIKLATRRYAKRQRTWFRKDARIRWLDATSRDIPSLVEEALELLDDGVA